MKRVLQFSGQALLWCGRAALRAGLWTLWLALLLLLTVQAWIALSHELAVPGFVLRLFEERLAAAHIEVKFGPTRFDPTGRILLENVRLSLPAYREPVAVAPAAYLTFQPWDLLAGRFELQRLELSGASFTVPAMLSHSGQAEEIVRALDATLVLRDRDIQIEQLSARVAGIAVTARGGLHLVPRAGPGLGPESLPDYFAAHYPEVCRHLIRAAERLETLESPELRLELTPSRTRGALARVTIAARGVKIDRPFPLVARGVRFTTRFPLQGDTPVMAPLTLTVDELQAGEVTLRAVQARQRGRLLPSQYSYEPSEMSLTAGTATARGFTLSPLAAHLEAGPLPRLKAEVIAASDGEAFAVRGEADLTARTAALNFDGSLAPGLLEPVGRVLRHDLSPFIRFGAPIRLTSHVTFAPGWRFERLAGQVYTRNVLAHHVPLDEGGGDIELEAHRFYAHHAFARLGANLARGSFEQDFTNLRYRFLLEGWLRPLDISGWFGRWWPTFFGEFAFPLAPPDASVDVAGQWKQGHLTTVFVYADAKQPVVRGVSLDHLRTLIFIRPNFYDGQELFVTLGPGAARGSFTREVEPGTFALKAMDLDFVSTLPLAVPADIFGPAVAGSLSAFAFAEPPEVRIKGHFDGPASGHGVHQAMDLQAESTGPFAFYGFPLANLGFHATVRDDEVVLRDVTATFAGGRVTGQARVWGHEPDRRLGFDFALADGSLGQAVRVMEEFGAARKGLPPPPPGKFVQAKAGVRLDLAASAEGRYTDPYSYHGSGHATLEGASLAEVNLLGLLSELLPFTSLRFTAARANFTIDGGDLTFSEVTATGANSAIRAHGRYALRERQLDFKARVNPFQESTFLPTVLIGAVLMPFSNVLEVKLTGTLDKPAWDFVNGPTNFIRNLTRPATPAATTPAAPETTPDYLRR
ncbi:MAG: hypothetical protein JSR48_08015 [Verrucomicrobia bacterium]|nr:hypothetical protein [Verrucomicrobiota bacterium]